MAKSQGIGGTGGSLPYLIGRVGDGDNIGMLSDV